MSSLNRLSTLIGSQLPQFIRDDHPVFVEFLEKYFEFLEQPGSPVYELKRFEDNHDIDLSRSGLLRYFKSSILPSFPEETELSTERILKASRDFYAKKGTADSFKFLFKVLYDKDLEVFFPKLQILKASDGKWIQPQAFRLTLSEDNADLDINLLESKKAYGSISRASCVVESVNRTIDKSTNREILEIYISNLNRLFQNGEYLEIEYVDDNDQVQVFSEKIIGALSNIRINPNRRGTKYNSGDPIVIEGGLDTDSLTARKAVAVVGNVTTGSVETVSVIDGGYGFRTFPNALVDIATANGIGANIIVSGVDTTNQVSILFNTDSIIYKANTLLNASDYDFDNLAFATINSTISSALSYETLNLAPITILTVINGGSFFETEPTLDVEGLYESDYSEDEGVDGFIEIQTGEFNTYNNVNASIKFSGSEYSSLDNFYVGNRLHVEDHYRVITRYDGATKTAFLNRPFESNINETNILTRNLYIDPRPAIKGMGRIGKIEILNGGVNYSNSDTIIFVGTGCNANANIVVSSGVITQVNLLDRGEGYPVAPTIIINTSTGSGGVLSPIMLGDGEDLTVGTGKIGQIRDIILVNRGSDYVNTPNVSLKVYDLNVASIQESESILNGDIVYQGANINTTTFRATVDEYFPSNNILRVFNYSGAPSIGQNLVVYKTTTANINTLVQFANVSGKIYPYRYGDGKAKANAEFLNGLIKYNGFYLNTDGHISSDKRLQDSDRYHNYSYSLVSEVQQAVYRKTIMDIAHPAGTKMIPFFVVRKNHKVNQLVDINVHTTILSSNSLTNNVSYDIESTNLFLYSEQLDNAVWTKNQVTITQNATTAPDGNVTADLVIPSASASTTFKEVQQNISHTINEAYTFSVYAKADGYQYVQIVGNAGSFGTFAYNIDLSNGTETGFTAGTSTILGRNIQSIGNGWYRISITSVALSTSTGRMALNIIPANNSIRGVSWTGDGVSGVYMWGMQIEKTIASTPYIQTLNSAVARANNIVTGLNENFLAVASINDMIVINSANASRSFIRTITAVNSNNSLTIESPCVVVGDGRARSNSGNAVIHISGNSNVLATTVTVGDRIRLNIANTELTKSVSSISGNAITLNTATGISESTNNLVYLVYPQFNVVEYEIIKTSG